MVYIECIGQFALLSATRHYFDTKNNVLLYFLLLYINNNFQFTIIERICLKLKLLISYLIISLIKIKCK
jgi:hypothetical protein